MRSALALTRRQLRTLLRERDESAKLAQVLQSSLLPPRLPATPGVDVAAAYLPASGGQVVGDFYDLFETGELAGRVDFGAARILRDDLPGMEEALTPVFAVSPELRTKAVVRQLGDLGHMLGAARYRNVPEATRTAEAIEDFTARRIPAAQPINSPYDRPLTAPSHRQTAS